MINPTSATSTKSTNAASSGAATNANGMMGKDSFLKLLMAQLQNQDPLNPMESYDFTGQLAQFTQIEQLSDMKDIMQKSYEKDISLANSINNSLAVNLINKEVKVNSFYLNFDGTDPVEFSFDVPNDALTLGVSVYNMHGSLVKNLDMTSFDIGTNTLTWDGKNQNNETVEPGSYYISVAYRDADNNTYNVETYVRGLITGVSYKNGTTYVIVNGIEIDFNNIREIIGDGSRNNNGNNGTVNDNNPVDNGGDDNSGNNELGDDSDG
jgi:flagellar basal-body rod modification protein FlgD